MPSKDKDTQAPEAEVLDDSDTSLEEEVAQPAGPVRIADHPSAAAEASEAELAAAKGAGDYYIGLWGDKPNYGCPYCTYASIEGPGAVELHIMAKLESGDLAHREGLTVPEGVR